MCMKQLTSKLAKDSTELFLWKHLLDSEATRPLKSRRKSNGPNITKKRELQVHDVVSVLLLLDSIVIPTGSRNI